MPIAMVAEAANLVCLGAYWSVSFHVHASRIRGWLEATVILLKAPCAVARLLDALVTMDAEY
jgi:hypothetical protein